jgi:transcriptional regulator with XRE-family HTH domain
MRSCFRATCVKPLDKNLGRVIRARRKVRGFTQEELARRCGVSRRHLIAIERGANFTVAVLIALAGALGEIEPRRCQASQACRSSVPRNRTSETLVTFSEAEDPPGGGSSAVSLLCRLYVFLRAGKLEEQA